MTLDAGDKGYPNGETITLDTGGNTVEKGDAVTFDGSGNITQTSATDDEFVGVVQELEADDKVTVHIAGLVVAVNIDGSVSAGDTLVPSGTTNGQFVSHTGGMYNPNPDTSADPVASNHPLALESGADGDVILAALR